MMDEEQTMQHKRHMDKDELHRGKHLGTVSRKTSG